ncbi:MAG: hypothetical protein Q8P90_03235 [bacterium]|nr:hypothetical protein [bacterium]
MKGKQIASKNPLSESDILSGKNADINKAFIELYQLYAADIYRYCYAGLYHHTRLAEQTVEAIFAKSFKYFHSFEDGGASYRSYLFSLAVSQVVKQRSDMQEHHHDKLNFSNRKFNDVDMHLWRAIQSLDPTTFSIYELMHGEQLTFKEIALAVRFDEAEVRRRHHNTHSKFQQIIQDFDEVLMNFYLKRDRILTFSTAQESRILHSVMKTIKKSPSFVKQSWFSNLLKPLPLTIATSVPLVAAVFFLVTNIPAEVPVEDSVKMASPALAEPSIQQRPREIIEGKSLPAIKESTRSLTAVEGLLYGSDYVVKREMALEDEEELRPTININLPVNEFRSVPEADIYGVPESLDKDHLQLSAFNHFSSLPLNQFVYVNGTYYIEESETEYRPLFIAFNNDGSIEFQMRQAAICGLEKLTEDIDEETARNNAYDFLASHNFIYVPMEELVVERMTDEESTITKGAVCNNNDEATVKDREFVFYPPHNLIRYGLGPDDNLPIRLRGIAVHMHGDTVTNVRVDRLHNLQDQIVKTETSELISIEDAISKLEDFYYPASQDEEDYQRFVSTFVQWNHRHGKSRLQEININQVRLEYVFDPLNLAIEPYYVFSGTGIDSSESVDIRMYVVASNKETELRGPYRE